MCARERGCVPYKSFYREADDSIFDATQGAASLLVVVGSVIDGNSAFQSFVKLSPSSERALALCRVRHCSRGFR